IDSSSAPTFIYTTYDISDRDACMECGACARDCPVDATEVDSEVRGCFRVLRGAEPFARAEILPYDGR
ncbi:MAG: 4Fe-4S binding protein, partial [Planctomycetes bacterium]|nr:4Fe-4S binding protein [Planctomycetota bacterium]